MTWKRHRGSAGRAVRAGAVAFLALVAVLGCGGAGGDPAVTARAAAVDVTYYYLPG